MNTHLFPITISIAAPAYNEALGIEKTIREWHTYLKQQKFIRAFEIVICNDGSTDNTGDILNNLTVELQELRTLHIKKNQGAAAALSHAIAATKFDWVLLMDADNQFPIENLNRMIATLHQTPCKAIHGIRDKRGHWFNRFGSKISGKMCNIIHKSHIKDFNSVFKLVKGPLLRSLHLETKGMNYSTEITSKLLEKRIPIIQINIMHNEREQGKSHVKFLRDGFHRFLYIIYIAFRQLLLKMGIIRRLDYEI